MPYRETPSQPSTGRQCPRCKTDLTRQALGPNQIERCASCHGVWLTAAEFNQLVSDLDRLEAVRRSELPRREPEQAVSYLGCPRCGEIMERTNFGRRSGIMVDTCKKHGIWLDRGELRQIADYLAVRVSPIEARAPAAAPPPRSRAPDDRDAGLYSVELGFLDALIEFLTRPFT